MVTVNCYHKLKAHAQLLIEPILHKKLNVRIHRALWRHSRVNEYVQIV